MNYYLHYCTYGAFEYTQCYTNLRDVAQSNAPAVIHERDADATQAVRGVGKARGLHQHKSHAGVSGDAVGGGRATHGSEWRSETGGAESRKLKGCP